MISNFWNLRVNERLTQWKDLRLKINDLPLDKAMEFLSNWWSTAPFVNYYLAPDSPETWPDPWNLIAENYYCDLAKALGIMYSLYFTSHKDIDVTLRIYRDVNTNTRYHAVYINDGEYIINHWPFEIVNTTQLEKENLQLLYCYTCKDLELEKY